MQASVRSGSEQHHGVKLLLWSNKAFRFVMLNPEYNEVLSISVNKSIAFADAGQ